MSFTVTVKLHAAVLPWMSVAVATTVVVPTANVLPLAAASTIEAIPQLSEAVAAKVTTADQLPASLLTLMLAGQVTTGASVSFTVTVKVQLTALPDGSVAVAVTVVLPCANTDPGAML